MSQRDLLRTALQMGLRSAGYRVLWEIDRKSRFKALRTPVGAVPMPREIVTHAEWFSELPPDHCLRTFARHPPSSQRDVFPPQAGGAKEGSAQGEHDSWHLEPNTGREWPLLHWTEAIDAPVGDLRTTWEPSRFVHVWDRIRSSRRDPSARREHAQVLAGQIDSWRAQNPFRAGIHWASGQELALRSLSWLCGFAAFGDLFDTATTRSLVELLYWHGVQIDAEFGLAQRSIANNHALAEAFALAAIGDAMPGFEEADRWRTRGLDTLVQAAPQQFSEDGGYCQASLSYERFALELLLWSEAWFGDVLDFSAIFRPALGLFETVLSPDGRVPNFGPNDSARAFRLTDAELNDFRPLVGMLRARLGAGVPPQWDFVAEACDWLALPPPRPGALPTPPSRSFPEAGLHILRSAGWFAMLRCGELPVRGGHADALHVDVRLAGRPVAIDAGTESYTGPAHDESVAASSHNGVTLNDEEPRRRIRRFTWAAGPQPSLHEYDAGRAIMRGRYDLGEAVLWERTVEICGVSLPSGVRVEDRLSAIDRSTEQRVYTLRWLLDATLEDVSLRTDDGGVEVSFGDISLRVEVRAERLFGLSAEVVATTHAPAYGRTEPAARVEVRATAPAVTFVSHFEAR